MPTSERTRVAITGLGVVSPVGVGVPQFWRSLSAGTSGIRPLRKFDASPFSIHVAGEIVDFDPLQHLPRRDVVRTDPFVHYALVAALEAVADAHLGGATDPDRLGVSIGTGIGGISWLTAVHDTIQREGPAAVSPYAMPGLLPNMAAGWLAIRLGARGPAYVATTACAAGTQAIGDAFRAIQWGHADVMVAGGADAVIHPVTVGCFAALRALTTNADPETACRPFDQQRDGFVLAEGSGAVVLERLDRARARGAPIYAEVIGYGLTCDAHHITASSVEGPANAIRQALSDAALSPADVDYINAHGTSTLHNDVNETKAIKSVFGDHAPRVAISSTKSMTGHLVGAAGAVEAVATALTITHGLIPPTINYHVPDPTCDLDYVPNKARVADVNVALSNSFAFGGVNAILALRRPA